MKHNREKREVHQFKNRAGWTDEHHLKNRCQGGQSLPSNMLRIDAYRHDAIYLLFGNKSLDEIILILLRLQRMKRRLRIHKRIH